MNRQVNEDRTKSKSIFLSLTSFLDAVIKLYTWRENHRFAENIVRYEP